jgi:hypothetical protein
MVGHPLPPVEGGVEGRLGKHLHQCFQDIFCPPNLVEPIVDKGEAHEGGGLRNADWGLRNEWSQSPIRIPQSLNAESGHPFGQLGIYLEVAEGGVELLV